MNFDSPSLCLAVMENSQREIGFAVLDLKSSPLIEITQFVDSLGYNRFNTKLNILQPSIILIPQTSLNSPLSHMLLLYSRANSCEVIPAPRKLFNDSTGMNLLQRFVVPEAHPDKFANCYLALACVSALVEYIESRTNVQLIPASLQFKFSTLENTLVMDWDTVKNLEIVANFRTGQTMGSLLAVLNHTKTVGGTRLLKRSLLEPLYDINTLNARLDVIEELLLDEQRFHQLQKILGSFLDISSLLIASEFTHKPTKGNFVKNGATLVKNILSLKQALHQSSLLADLIQDCKSPLLLAIQKNLNQPGFKQLSQEIARVIVDSPISKSTGFQAKLQQANAIRPGVDTLLDLARQSFSENLQDVQTLLETYRSQFHLPSLKLQYSAKKGHYFAVDKTLKSRIASLPLFFLQREVSNKVCFSSQDLERINSRSMDSWNEIMIKTEEVLQKLMEKIRENFDLLYNLSDSVSWLDMMGSFATYVTVSGPTCRPIFTDTVDSSLVIKQGRHPILDQGQGISVVPNDVFASSQNNFQLITGPNMSGKSTYIRQIALLHVMAHIGCFVPATFASFRLTHQIFTRIGTFDQLESNSSTFSKEMSEMSYITQMVNNHSLVLIDELGRSTSIKDAIPICWSLSEHLAVRTQAFSFFVTHLEQLSMLESVYPNIKNYHLRVDALQSASSPTFQCLFQVGEGPSKISSYGILMAEKAGLPLSLIKGKSRLLSDFAQNAKTVTATKNLLKKLFALRNSSLDFEQLKNFLEILRNQYLTEIH